MSASFYKWKDLDSFFAALNSSGVSYVVLSNYELMHTDAFFLDEHKDIDFLVEDAEKFIERAHAVRKMWPEDDIHCVVFIGKDVIPIDIRSVGDGYYDTRWEKDLLATKRLADNGKWYVPSFEQYYFSLVYHAYVQKTFLSKGYKDSLEKMRSELSAAEGVELSENHIKNLRAFMRRKGYKFVRPSDSSVVFNREYAGKKIPSRQEVFSFAFGMLQKCKPLVRFVRACRTAELNNEMSNFNNSRGTFSDIGSFSRKISRKFGGVDVYDVLSYGRVYKYLIAYKNDMELKYLHLKDKMRLKICLDVPAGTVFTMWWQGIERAPNVIKACVESLKKLGRNVIVLDKDNIRNYCGFPDYVWKKLAFTPPPPKNVLCVGGGNYFSEIARCYVLAMYGGVWVEPSVYIAGGVPSYMLDNFFLFKESSYSEQRTCSNWWLSAPAGHPVFLRQLAGLLVYWENEPFAYDCRLFDIVWKMMVGEAPEFYGILDAVPSRFADSASALLENYNKPFDEEEWKIMKEISPVFKCSNKRKGFGTADSYYIRLCEGSLP